MLVHPEVGSFRERHSVHEPNRPKEVVDQRVHSCDASVKLNQALCVIPGTTPSGRPTLFAESI
jgi:hypothetical protein